MPQTPQLIAPATPAVAVAVLSPANAAIATTNEAGKSQRPNILFILADDLGRTDVGFMGCKEIRTSHLDKLANAGAVLDAFYVQPVCSPTRAALLTGRNHHSAGTGMVTEFATGFPG